MYSFRQAFRSYADIKKISSLQRHSFKKELGYYWRSVNTMFSDLQLIFVIPHSFFCFPFLQCLSPEDTFISRSQLAIEQYNYHHNGQPRLRYQG